MMSRYQLNFDKSDSICSKKKKKQESLSHVKLKSLKVLLFIKSFFLFFYLGFTCV